MSYKRIGDFIELVDERNRDLEVTTLLGLSISKQFIPSVANTIGTNMKTYKIIRKNQFACSVMQVRRDGKMPVALLKDFDEAIISQAYPVFQVIDETELLPDYLMMWFTRSEFDRQATFHAVGGVRGSLEWEDFLDFELPIPSIEKQQQIVAEYNTVTNRIQLNEKINNNLEATAQVLYKHWFVDFEFPNTENKPYKTSGGEMIYNEELDKEIPVGWSVKQLNSFIGKTLGGDWGKSEKEGNYKMKVKCIRGTDIPTFKSGNTENAPIRYILEKNHKNRKIEDYQIVIELSGGSPTQSTGRSVLVTKEHLKTTSIDLICSNFCRILTLNDKQYSILFQSHLEYLYNMNYLFMYENSTIGVKNFDLSSFLLDELLIKPNKLVLAKFNSIYEITLKEIINKRLEIKKLEELQSLLLAKMTQVENKATLV